MAAGLFAVFIGNFCRWRWVNTLWFRIAHTAAIGIVVVEVWLGVICPLTTLEMWLREKAGETTYSGGFIAYWLQWLLYYDAPSWVFAAGYTLFGLLVAAAWYCFPPVSKHRSNKGRSIQNHP